MASKPNHPYHLVDPSPWPIIGSISIFIMLVGAILFLRNISHIVLGVGFVLTLFTLLGWWRDVIKEANTPVHTDAVRMGFRVGMVLFIVSEVMFFVAFFWGFFDGVFHNPPHVWPPKGIHPLETWDLPYFNTLLLLLSGTTVTWAHSAIADGNTQDAKRLLLITIFLGFLFLGVQAYEYSHATFAFKGGIYPSTFYMATGFHGLHVLIGALFLTVTWFRTRAGHFKKGDHFGFDAAAWYWHFVDVVWLFLFMAIYWWGSGNAGTL